jgi:hypothetical protein
VGEATRDRDDYDDRDSGKGYKKKHVPRGNAYGWHRNHGY